MHSRVQDLTLRYGLFKTLDRDHFYPTLKAAVREVQELGPLPPAEALPDGQGHRHRKTRRNGSDGAPKT
jgi:hypothetical protein